MVIINRKRATEILKDYPQGFLLIFSETSKTNFNDTVGELNGHKGTTNFFGMATSFKEPKVVAIAIGVLRYSFCEYADLGYFLTLESFRTLPKIKADTLIFYKKLRSHNEF